MPRPLAALARRLLSTACLRARLACARTSSCGWLRSAGSPSWPGCRSPSSRSSCSPTSWRSCRCWRSRSPSASTTRSAAASCASTTPDGSPPWSTRRWRSTPSRWCSSSTSGAVSPASASSSSRRPSLPTALCCRCPWPSSTSRSPRWSSRSSAWASSAGWSRTSGPAASFARTPTARGGSSPWWSWPSPRALRSAPFSATTLAAPSGCRWIGAGRLRAGEVVQFGAAPSHALVSGRVALPFSRGFAAPMVCRDSFEGALFVGYDEEDAGGLMDLVQGIARQAALALVNVRTMEQQQQDAEVSRVLLSLSQGLSSCLDEDALWQLLVHGASEVLDLPWSIAARFDERSGTFSIAGGSGVPQADLDAIGNGRFRLEDFPRLQEAITRRELLIGDGATVRPLWLPRGWRSGAWIAIPLFRSGWVAGFTAAGRLQDRRAIDRRQLRLAEGLGHHASIALQNARLVADLEAADRLKSEFVSTMSHELRTPLNVIIGYTEMLREGAVGPITLGQRELIDRLDARGRELLELIEATLHVGRLEAGRDMVEISAVALGDLLQALRSCTSGLPRADGVAFEWETPPDLAQRIMTDRAKVSLVVRNLVSNAFKFTSEGQVLVRMLLHDEAMVIEGSDTGVGIGAEHLPVIFDMFRQVDGSATRRHGGVGP